MADGHGRRARPRGARDPRRRPLPRARSREHGRPFLVLTNNSIYTRRDLAARLRASGLEVPEESIWTSALATARFLEDQRPGGSAFVIGEAGLTTALHEAGYTLTERNPDYVVLGETRTYSFERITQAIRLIVAGARFIATNPDPTGPAPDGPLPATGSVAALISRATGRRALLRRQAQPADDALGAERDRRPLGDDRDDRRPDGHRHRRPGSRPGSTRSSCSPASPRARGRALPVPRRRGSSTRSPTWSTRCDSRRVALTRRQVLAGGAAAAAGAALSGCGDRGERAAERAAAANGPRPAAPPEDLSTWAGVRRELPLDPRIRQFSAFLLAAHPRPVRAAIEHHRALLDADPEGYLRSGENRADPAGAAARYLGGARDDIALTTSTTMGLAILYRALRLRGREEILSTVHDHFATDEALRLSGGRVRRVASTTRRPRRPRRPTRSSRACARRSARARAPWRSRGCTRAPA